MQRPHRTGFQDLNGAPGAQSEGPRSVQYGLSRSQYRNDFCLMIRDIDKVRYNDRKGVAL